MKRRTFIRLVCLVFVLTVCCVGLISCGKYERIDDMADELVEAIVENDLEDAVELFDFRYGESQIASLVSSARKLMSGERSYRIRRTEVIESNFSGGASGVAATYLIYTYEGVYQLKVQRVDGIRGFASARFEKLLGEGVENKAVVGEAVIFWIITVACVGFCVWMIVDCIRRTVSRSFFGKAVWIIIIGFGAVLRVTFGSGGFDLSSIPSLMGIGSSMTVTEDVARLCVFLPVGGILYFVLRKRLSDKYAPKEEVVALDQGDENAQKEISTEEKPSKENPTEGNPEDEN